MPGFNVPASVLVTGSMIGMVQAQDLPLRSMAPRSRTER